MTNDYFDVTLKFNNIAALLFRLGRLSSWKGHCNKVVLLLEQQILTLSGCLEELRTRPDGCFWLQISYVFICVWT